ncbi:hypothetical protein [uncultured Amnibacterium sp.]|uniref:hypothetical protein n=1 Tax=uncultured Amnibacterium sp. TaxID=1631851 RepID=UPI0035CB9A1C
MSSRLVPTQVFRAHWKALSDYRGDKIVPDRTTRTLVVAMPVVAGVLFGLLGGRLGAPDALLAAVSLLAGGFLAAFSQVATFRARLTERAEMMPDAERADRDSLDETAAHLLVAAYMSGITALVLVIATNVSEDKHGGVVGWWGALAVATGLHVLIVFAIAIPRLYNAYAHTNGVRKELSGTHRGRR